jgi:hypothetical protein
MHSLDSFLYQPEWAFQSILKTLETHSHFMSHDIQTIHNQLGLQQSALTEFITVLLPILQRKFDHILPDLRKNGFLLSHFMHESLSFDSVIREKYLYIPTGNDKWEGLTQYFLRSPTTFKTWRNAEKDCT